MIDAAGGMIPFLCHVFLILFGGFFAINLSFNKNFTKSFGYESIEASYMGRPLGFMMFGLVLMFIATLFQIGGYNSTNEIYTVLFIFTSIGFIYNMSLYLKILPTHNGEPHEIKHAIRPLIPWLAIVIRALTL